AEGFESAYGMELLASVHWVSTGDDECAVADPESAAQLIQSWTSRKSRLFTSQHVEVAWDRLHDHGWLKGSSA
ncbi:MAG: hypothetical protein ACRDQF_18485, partial [Thermocrispum sp.]